MTKVNDYDYNKMIQDFKKQERREKERENIKNPLVSFFQLQRQKLKRKMKGGKKIYQE
jgi:hypothetical protein